MERIHTADWLVFFKYKITCACVPIGPNLPQIVQKSNMRLECVYIKVVFKLSNEADLFFKLVCKYTSWKEFTPIEVFMA
ncbi:hypothetical protein HanRHA438_Chr07g0323661 [Helianthus annuus]|nr:hypothetical protein HanRHA438_Chr07g0323661 [Helianthus annuus]